MPPKGNQSAKDAAAEPEDGPKDPPAGGLDMPPVRIPLETESFPGESRLTEDERNRWLILHFALPRTIMTQDMETGRTTEQELNNLLACMAWGTIDQSGGAGFVLESEDPTLDPPHEALISYAEYVDRSYPADANMEDAARKENERVAEEKKNTCTAPGEPVVKFRPMFDQVVKNLVHANKALQKAYDIKKFTLNENDVPEDPNIDDQRNVLRYGRYQIIPAFFNLLIQLTKDRRRFSLCFRTYNPDQLPPVQRELRLLCDGKHPAYSGQNKTQKPPPMNGDKQSRDMRLAEETIGRMNRMSGRFEFSNRAMKSAPAEIQLDADGIPIPVAFEPTVYEFPPYHKAHEGLMHHILDKANTCAIVDDWDYWKEKDCKSSAGKLLLVNHGGGVAETKVQHIFFDGHILKNNAHCVDVRDVVNGEPLPFAEADDVYMHRVDFYQACLDGDYFTKALKKCETKMSMKILESRRVAEEKAAESERPEVLKSLPPKEYLYRTVIPALLPALEACQRDRPADPIEFIAFYMLRHTHQYSKTLKA